MTWREIKAFLDKMDDSTLDSSAQVFNYETDSFAEAVVCLDGEPEFHLTIN